MATWLTDHSTCLTYISVLKKRDGSLIMMVSYKYVLLIEERYHWHFLEASAPGAPVTVSSTTVPVPEAGDETRHFPWRQNGWRWRVVFPSSGSLEEEEQVYTTFEGTANGNDLTTLTVLWFWDLAKPGVWFLCVPEMRTEASTCRVWTFTFIHVQEHETLEGDLEQEPEAWNTNLLCFPAWTLRVPKPKVVIFLVLVPSFWRPTILSPTVRFVWSHFDEASQMNMSKWHFRKTKEGKLQRKKKEMKQAKPSTIRRIWAKMRLAGLRTARFRFCCLGNQPWTRFWRREVIERSPLGRFVRFNRKLGSGSYKVVFLGFDNDTGPEAKIQIEVPKSLEDKENARLCRQHWDMLVPGMEVAWNIISFQNLDKLHTEFTRCQYVWVWRIQLGSLEPLFCKFLFEGLVAGTLRLLQLFLPKRYIMMQMCRDAIGAFKLF